MNYSIFENKNAKYLEFKNGNKKLFNESDGLEVINICFETGIRSIMLHEEMISQDFFNLKTGLAGFVLQKLINYRIKAALVMKDDSRLIGRFKEMASESNNRNEFRVFMNKDVAEQWLTS